MSIAKAIIITVLAWIVGTFTEICFGLYYGQNVVFPLIAMGVCVLYALSENEKKLFEIRKLLKGEDPDGEEDQVAEQ